MAEKNLEVCGSVMDGVAEKGGVLESPTKKGQTEYTVYPTRWLVLGVFVFYSASNSLQWIQYAIIQDTVVKYYNVSSSLVYWTSMVFMITYIPLIFPASWLLDKTVCLPHFFFDTDLCYCLRFKSLGQLVCLSVQTLSS